MTDSIPKPPNIDFPPPVMENPVRTKKSNKKPKNDAKVSIKLSGDVAKSSHKIKKGAHKNTRSNSSVKSSSSVRSLEDMDDGDEDIEEMKDGEAVVDDEIVTDEVLLAKKPKVSNEVNRGEFKDGMQEKDKVSVMFPEVEVNISANNSVGNKNDKNDSLLNKANVVTPDIPIPTHDTNMLNTKQNDCMQPNSVKSSDNVGNHVLLGSLHNQGGMENGIQGLKHAKFKVGESSKSKDVEMQDTTSFKRPMSFSSAVKGPYGNKITTAMCERSNGRANFARVLVEVDATKGIVDSVEMCYRGLGRFMFLNVEYAWKPPICSHCKVFGHDFKDCKNREATVEETLEAMKAKAHSEVGADQDGKNNDGWKAVQGKKANKTGNDGQYMQQESFPNGNGWNYARGGTSFRGRGGYGRGGYNGVRANNDNRSATTYTKPAENVSKSVETAKWNKTNEKVNAKDSSNGKTLPKELLKTSNSFGALVNENVEDVSNDWQNMKTKIDVACDLGLEIPDDERKNWSSELQDYYVVKCKELVKGKRRSQLMDRIKSLEKEIVGSNRGIDAVVNKKTESLVTEEMENNGASRSQAYKRNLRLFGNGSRSIDGLYAKIVETVRFKLLGLNMKQSMDVQNAAKVWNLPLRFGDNCNISMTNPSHNDNG
ncbi:hypothetical protein CTI12_AA183160 [Artemisia annua]|uniref:Zinc knuckle CX2CX4HX4C n=1 Tax=Artemisia annua TaxID=35608 RepID=A0A2U1P832_ARTAN|nr:hypothetical protein CTI12_AA183160 [Artemisia annua]